MIPALREFDVYDHPVSNHYATDYKFVDVILAKEKIGETPLFDYIVDHLNALKLTYIHVVEGATGGPRDIAPFDYGSLRKRFKQAYVANNGYDFELATKVLAANEADLIAFGKPFIANPDLVERLKRGAPLNPADKMTFYGGDAKGYTDYPALGEALDAAVTRRCSR
jgi:N-ethylmaleimide reductase